MSKEVNSVEHALKLALKLLKTAQNNLAPSKHSAHLYGDGELWDEYAEVIKALEEALAKQEQSISVGEPVAYPEGDVVGACICGSWPGGKCLKCPRITTPYVPEGRQQRKPLTDEQMSDWIRTWFGNDADEAYCEKAGRAIEAVHGITEEKNT